MSSGKNPQHFYSVYTAGSKTLSNKLGASSKRAKEEKPELENVTEREQKKARILHKA